MRLAAINLARYIAFVELNDFNPRGEVHFNDLIPALVQRCGFTKSPQKPEEMDATTGIVFEGGKVGEVNNVSLRIFTHGLAVDTLSSTADSEKALEKILWWALEKFKIHYSSEMIKRKVYLSQVIFHSDLRLDKLNTMLGAISKKLTQRVGDSFGVPLEYSSTGLIIGYDSTHVKDGPSVFTVERRASIPFSENKYFSQAPLPTDEHIKLLEEFEAAVVSTR